MRLSLLISLLAFLLSGCATPNTHISVKDNSIIFNGEISRSTADAFISLATSNPINHLSITSGGGDVDSAIDMALFIFERKIDVEVTNYCFSSCANYIFPAGQNKYITGVGIVAWHGNMRHLQYLVETGKRAVSSVEKSSIDRLVKQESSFFAKVSVDEFMCWFGKIDPFLIQNFYVLSKEDMELFGLSNLHVRANYKESNLRRFRWFDNNYVQWISATRERLNAYRPSRD
jgi:hypothetical protein